MKRRVLMEGQERKPFDGVVDGVEGLVVAG